MRGIGLILFVSGLLVLILLSLSGPLAGALIALPAGGVSIQRAEADEFSELVPPEVERHAVSTDGSDFTEVQETEAALSSEVHDDSEALEPGRIAGYALDVDGEPLKEHRLLAFVRGKGPGIAPLRTRTDANGDFVFPKVPAGIWAIYDAGPVSGDGVLKVFYGTVEVLEGQTSSFSFALHGERRLQARVVVNNFPQVRLLYRIWRKHEEREDPLLKGSFHTFSRRYEQGEAFEDRDDGLPGLLAEGLPADVLEFEIFLDADCRLMHRLEVDLTNGDVDLGWLELSPGMFEHIR